MDKPVDTCCHGDGIAVLDVFSVWIFGFLCNISVNGKLETFLDVWREGYKPVSYYTVGDYIFANVFALIFFLFVLVLLMGTLRTISKPFSSGFRFKVIFTVIVSLVIAVSGIFVFGVCHHIDSRDEEQYQAYSQVINDTVNLLDEMKTIETYEIDKVLERFDYLTFEKQRSKDNDMDLYSAVIGEPTLTEPIMFIEVYDDGRLYIYFSVDEGADAVSLSPFVFLTTSGGGGRWGQRSGTESVQSYIENAQEGDSLEGLFNIVRENNVSFRYSNDNAEGCDRYTFHIDVHEFLVNSIHGEVYAFDGEFVRGSFKYD